MPNLQIRRLAAIAGSLVLALGATTSAHAGSIITTNLSADTVAIVNIDARNDGAGNFGPGQSAWFSPFAANGQLNQLTLGPGTYTFDLIDPTDAAAAYPNLTSAQRSQLFTSWTFNSPWVTDYFVFDSSAVGNPSQPQLFAGAISPNPQSFGNPQAAYNAAKANGYSDRLMTGPGGRTNGTEAFEYTLTQTQTLIFVVPDNGLGDNGGGLSVAVRTQAVPEPASLAALALGGLALVRRRRARRDAA